MSEKLLLRNNMMKTNEIGVRIIEARVNFSVRCAIARQSRVKGIIVLAICQAAILSSLAM